MLTQATSSLLLTGKSTAQKGRD